MTGLRTLKALSPKKRSISEAVLHPWRFGNVWRKRLEIEQDAALLRCVLVAHLESLG